ncbi:MAG: putative membrane protein containing PLD-nuclease N-terminal domain [Candidatus Methanohalarchaeum thermophilum]|uniref:Membrane protein containing PLD-nuclease N-terminal domain n=1 Tax=Methanohalarchaeum thermophilum TaxID=1903181 RepID=A0A1Q6DT25_METT1|nr:MAG: putative membrane protein containing PLD-nuclease N-terminal domain [Candidatus Methanohalarchaeum thermophilum]
MMSLFFDMFWFGTSFAAGLGLLINLISLILLIWVLYDTLVVQEGMDEIEKLIWIIASFILPIIIPLAYYFIVKVNETYLMDGGLGALKSGSSDVDELEKLHELKEKGVLTEKEFEEKKKEILNK